ncbi:hypothetical protein INH39_30130 [Massilia violaceinigra]|uniref:GH18 domain-containing protein n=1 Tax=Massilia violaceinigra TaxID=2045208 RepID=A0ABY4A497_9BURK|nr:hypothetical protein [Massilia violaceinigra]UOD29599.1 hypothetical protein INH39_30130 [Massilia violaceinigra]
MTQLNLAVYAEGCMYPEPDPSTLVNELKSSRFTTVILGLFHVSAAGDLYFNNEKICSQGAYVGAASWKGTVAALAEPKDGKQLTVCASVGGGGVSDFSNLRDIYAKNNASFAGTELESNFKQLRASFPAVSIIDMDCEDTYDQPSLVAFCRLLAGMGFGLTFCPYTNQAFWVQALAQLNDTHPGTVRWWNLQCYDGGQGNQPSDWADIIREHLPTFSTDGFILPGDWTNDSPDQVQALMHGFAGKPSVGGGFMWTLGSMHGGDRSVAGYALAMANGLQAAPGSARGE